METLTTIVGLVGVLGFLFGVVNLVVPIRRLGIASRRQAAGVTAASFGVVLVMALVSSGDDQLQPEAAVTSTTVASVESSSTSHASTTTSSTSATTSTTTPSTTTITLPPDPLLAPPTASGAGDPASPLPTGAESVTVVSITDGDTLDVKLGDGSVATVRLIGINTAETTECFSSEATASLSALTPPGSNIGMTVDVSDVDDFGRLLRYLWVGGMSVNGELVSRGAAIARRYPPDTAMAPMFEDLQQQARDAQLGLWAPDVCGARTDADLSIVAINHDPPGDDTTRLNDEWIQVRNDGAAPVDLTGWTVRDESSSNRFAFPAAFVLAAGEMVTIRSGCGDNSGSNLYWCSSRNAIWNNDGDTGFLLDPNGNIITTSSYAPPTITTATTIAAAPVSGGGDDCDSSYPDVCIPPAPPDLDCGDIPHKRFKVTGSDPHGFDRDKDGVGCES
jgi:micrococcal nuclease